MEPYPVETRDGVTVIRFFPRNVYWNFAREGQPKVRRAMWHLRDAWNRDAAQAVSRHPGRGAAGDRAHPSDRRVLRVDLAPRPPRRRAGRSHRARLPSAVSARVHARPATGEFAASPSVGCRVYRAWHLRTAADVDLFVSPSRFLLDRHREAGLRPRATR